MEVVPRLRKIPSPEPILSSDKHNFHKFKKVEVQDDLKVAFPELKKEMPRVKQDEKPSDETLVIEDDFDEALKHLLNTGLIDNTNNIAFFDGGSNDNFEKKFLTISASISNTDFLSYLQSEACARIMKQNKIKIHIESEDIYFNNTNTNESIYDFIKTQTNKNYILIDFDFSFDGTLSEYYNSYLSNLDNITTATNDYYTHRNSKFLFYHFNDLLLNLGRDLYKIRHTTTITNKVAVQIMQKNNWQYFISRLTEICINGQIGGDDFSPEEENNVMNYFKALLSVNETYKIFYDSIGQTFLLIFQNLPTDEKQEIMTDLQNHNIYLDDLDDINSETLMNTFIDFYNNYGRFPGNEKLVILPKFKLSEEIEGNVIDLKDFYEKFKGTIFRPLVSIQGLCAFLISLAGNNASALKSVSYTMEEFFINLLEDTLDIEDTNDSPAFRAVNRLFDDTRLYLNKVNERIILKAQQQVRRLRNELNQFAVNQQQEIEDSKILITAPETELPTSVKSDSEIKEEKLRLKRMILRLL